MSSPGLFSRLKLAASKPSAPVEKSSNPLRFGILGAANIAPPALITPARHLADVKIVGIAAREESKAKAFAAKHEIPKTYSSYDDLINDPEIDAIYIPTPNSLHHKWCLAALRAGKHVLCEKPLASNEDEAREIAEETQKSGKILMEAFHYRYHPLTLRLKEILESGEIGEVKSAKVKFFIPSLAFSAGDIRFNLALAGGALMDCGCYAINIMRLAMGNEPIECTKADIIPENRACGLADESQKKEVDGTTYAEFSFPNGATASIECTLNGSIFGQLAPSIDIEGSKGSIKLYNFVAPFVYHTLSITSQTEEGKGEKKTRSEKHYGEGQTTYYHQLKAFVEAVREGKPFSSTPEDGVRNMRVIDAVYLKAGLTPRGKFASG